MTDDTRRIYGGRKHLAPYLVREHWFAPESVDAMLGWAARVFPMEVIRRIARTWLPVLLGDANGDRDELRALVDPRLHDILDEVDAFVAPAGWACDFQGIYTAAGNPVTSATSSSTNLRLAWRAWR